MKRNVFTFLSHSTRVFFFTNCKRCRSLLGRVKRCLVKTIQCLVKWYLLAVNGDFNTYGRHLDFEVRGEGFLTLEKSRAKEQNAMLDYLTVRR